MNEIYFLVRYTPFWAVPILLMSLEFAYLFWLRKKKRLIAFCIILNSISIIALAYYYWAGGPEESVKYLMKLVRFYS